MKPGQGRDVRLRSAEPVTVLRGVGPHVAGLLSRSGILVLADLLRFFPRRLQQVELVEKPKTDLLGQSIRLSARIRSTSLRYLPARRSLLTIEFEARDGTPFRVPIFNQPYLRKSFRKGSYRLVEGRLGRRGGHYVLSSVRLLPRQAALPGPCSVRYPEIEGISEARLQALIRQTLERTDLTGLPLEPLPAGLAAAKLDPATALLWMHRPPDAESHERARLLFAVLEAVALFRRVERARRRRLARRGPIVRVSPALAGRIQRYVPFTWTADQRRAIAQITGALSAPAPMGMLLQGDVGTGKTAVAFYAALSVIASGHQVAFLAPTELLAEQHHALAISWLETTRVRIGLLTGSLTRAERSRAEGDLQGGRVDLIFGTHALLSKATRFSRLGLVIIDEQQRFGVAQRMSLIAKGVDPHVLVMTATPIPRTLALTLFGDLDLAVLHERPPGHRTVRAFFLPRKAWPRVLRAMKRHVQRGERVFLVCPWIGEDGERGGAVRLHEELARTFPCGLFHGRTSLEERRRVTAAFATGEISVLVGTTVLEVGVDVPEATLMVVVGADRFGLATLHQLRGRVGRGRKRGVCILTGDLSQRIEAVCRSSDGFELAEEDLRQRGMGELLGLRQSGVGELRALDPLADAELLQSVREAVRREVP